MAPTAVAASALGAALILLVWATGLPLWAFSAVASLVYALIVPLAAIAMTLLYGDAVAASTPEPQPEDDGDRDGVVTG